MKKSFNVDYLIVGCGLTGCVIAKLLADAGRDVMIVDRRNHIGGNVYDELHPSGIRVHTYGPHFFRTNSDMIWDFVNRFSKFYHFEAVIKSLVDGRYENWPIAASYIRRVVGDAWQPEFKGIPSNFEEASLSKMPRVIYEKFVKGYTQKQWGKDPSLLSVKLAGRFHVRKDDDPRLMLHKHQGFPENGYAQWVGQMIKGLALELSCDYLKEKDRFHVRKKLIYTGPIDEFFHNKFGRLAYRGQKREVKYYQDTDRYQIGPVINYASAQDGPQIRTIEWKQMMDPKKTKGLQGTVVTQEVPFTPEDPDHYEYPMVDEENSLLYQRYYALAASLSDTVFCGRLARYQYIDMDQAIEQAMLCAQMLLEKDSVFHGKEK